jgi:hypothetical protein
MENNTTTDGAKDPPSPIVPAVVPSSPEPNQKDSDRAVSVADQLPTWLKLVLIVLPVLAFIISLFSLGVSVKSLRFSMGYTRPYEDHDVVARVLGVTARPKTVSSIVTNGELFVDLALINRGNQTEIIRTASLCYSGSKDFNVRRLDWPPDNKQMNLQLNKGERRVLHLLTPFSSANTGTRMWLGVAVRAIAPNADDTEIVWPVCEIELAADGNGAWVSYNKEQTPLVQIISRNRLPHQKLALDGF